MFDSDALGDHMVEAFSSTGLVMALYVASMVSLCLLHLVEVRTLSMLIVLRVLVASRSMCLLLFAFQSMFISIWVARLEIAEFPDSVRRSAP